MNMQHAGELAGLATSALWVVSSLAFAAAGRSIGATQLNLLRSLLACAFLLGLQWFLHGNPWPTIGGHSTLFLAISGLLGLAIGDQFLFAGYVLVGPRTTTLLMTLAPATAASLSWIMFGQSMSWQAILGMAITLIGVLWVAAESPHAANCIKPGQQRKGIMFGAAAAVCQGIGMVLAGNALRGEVDAMSAQTVRMSAGTLAIIVIALVVHRMRKASPISPISPIQDASTPSQSVDLRNRLRSTTQSEIIELQPTLRWTNQAVIVAIVIGTFSGPVLGVWCSLIALQKLEVGIATTLMSLVPVMILPFSKWIEGRWPTPRAILGAIIAVVGVVILATAATAPNA